MKRVLSLLLLGIIVFSLSFGASAADDLYRMMHFDNEYFIDHQDALIVGQVIPSDNENLKIMIKDRVYVKDSIDIGDTIYLDPLVLYFNLPGEGPKVGDYVILPLKKVTGTDNFFMLSYAYMCRCDMGDIGSLSLYYDTNNPNTIDVLAIERFINSEGEDKNFAFSSNTLIITGPDGQSQEEIQLDNLESYLPDIFSQSTIDTNGEIATATADPKEKSEEDMSYEDLIPEPDNRIDKIVPLPVVIGAVVVFIICVVIYALSRGKEKRGQRQR